MIATSLRVVLSLGLLCLVGSWSYAADDLSALTKILFQQYDQLMSAGEDAAAEKLLKEAAARFQKFLDNHPDRVEVRDSLIRIQTNLREYPPALGNVEILIAQRPDLGSLHQWKGQLLLLSRQFEDAERSYRRAMKLEPKRATAILVEFGQALNFSDRPEQALTIAREAKKLDPQSDGPLLLMAAIDFRSENFGDWEKGLRAAIAARPKSNVLRHALLKGLLELQKLDKAYEEFLVVQELEPDNSDCVQWLIQLAPHLTFPVNPQAHVDRLYELHRTGKSETQFFKREIFDVGKNELTVWEYFEPVHEQPTKYHFHLADERCEVMLCKHQETNQFLRLADEPPLNGVAYVLYVKRDYKLERLQEFKELPTYQEARALAVEIFQRKPEMK